MRYAMPQIVGNENLRRRMCDDVRSGTLSHAYILEGPAGSGKHTVAWQLAAALACEHRSEADKPLPCGNCPACRKILDGKSPDIITYGREDKATIGIETIRLLREDVHTYPNDLDFKLYIIEDAHTLTQQAQNAFLLTLEEPPSFVHFLLLCENTQTILETIRSRAPILRMAPIPAQEIGEHLCRTDSRARSLKESAPGEWAELLLSADGRIGRAVNLLDAKARKPILARREAAEKFLEAFLSNRERMTRFLTIMQGLGNKREDVCEWILTLETALRDLLLLKKEENAPLLFYTDWDDAVTLSDRIPAITLLRLYEACEEARCAIHIRNANIRLTLMDLILKANTIRS